MVLSQYEDEIRDEPVENAVVITADGRIYRCRGTLNRVFIEDLGDALIDADVTHNHPIGSINEYSFSDDDISIFAEWNLHILRGVDERFTYQMTRNAGSVDKEPDDWMNEDNFRHSMVIRSAKAYGYGYRRWQNGEGRSES